MMNRRLSVLEGLALGAILISGVSVGQEAAAPVPGVTWDDYIGDHTPALEAASAQDPAVVGGSALLIKYLNTRVEWTGVLRDARTQEGFVDPEAGVGFFVAMPSRTVRVNGNPGPIVIDRVFVTPVEEDLASWRALKLGVTVRFNGRLIPMVVQNAASAARSFRPEDRDRLPPRVVVVGVSDARLVTEAEPER